MASLKKGPHRFVRAALLIILQTRGVCAGGLERMWQLGLDEWNPKSGNAQHFPVDGLSFSPDGKQIAITGTERMTSTGKIVSLLLVAEIGNVKTVRQFEVLPGGVTPDWSPAGETILVSERLVDLERGRSCSMPPISRFFDHREILGQSRDPGTGGSHFTIFDDQGTPGRAWATSEHWNIVDVSLDRGMVLMNKPLTENLLVDPVDGRVLSRWSMGSWPLWDGPGGKFADSGKALCNEISLDHAPKGQTLRCWKTDSRELIGYAPADYASSPFAVSARSTRVVFSDYSYIQGPVRDLDSHPYAGAVVWDYAANKKIASWTPESQTYEQIGLRPPKRIKEPCKVAISADGKFVAQAGNGKLTIYRVLP